MRKSGFTESQIIKAVKANESGQRVEDLCRELGIRPTTFYGWREKYSGMEASQLKRLKELEEEIGLPKVIRVDNGPEFISKEFTAWCERRAIV